MKKIVILISLLIFAQSAFAQNTSRYFAGDYKYTASEFTINANTPNGTDSGRMNISGGGGTGTSSSRGGSVSVFGADRGGAGAGGDVQIITADNGDILFNAHGAGGYIDFRTGNEQKWFMAPSAASNSELYYGKSGTGNWHAKILAATSNGNDDDRFTISGGGAVGGSRGAFIDLYGADRGGAGLGGDVLISTADNGDLTLNTAGSGDIVLDSDGATGYIDFNVNGEQKWFMSPSVAGTSELYYGELGSGGWIGYIMNSSSPGTDSGRMTISGGGGIAVSRGGRIALDGADYGGPGAGGAIRIISADAGNITIDASEGGNVILETVAGIPWSDFGTTGAGACTIANGKYANMKINSAAVKVAICD